MTQRALDMESIPVTLVLQAPTIQNEDPIPPVPEGQIVDVVIPDHTQTPEEAEYLAQRDQSVEQETMTDRYRVNPEVLSETYSTDDQLQFEEAIDLNVDEPSTGAQVGNDSFDPDRDGQVARLPSPFTLTNRDGMQRPVPAASTTDQRAGAPNNDLLNEDSADATRLNTREYLYHSYITRIRRLVNFYWNQNIQNVPRSEPLVKPSYTTLVNVTLDGNGSVESIGVQQTSGSDVLDNCIVDAFRIAGPFPNPPESLVSDDGRVYLPDFGFTLEVGHARAPFHGVDPRQDVRFPGILKATQ